MVCACGGDPAGPLPKRREALQKTPFFAALTDTEAGAAAVDQLAAEAQLRIVKEGVPLEDVPFGTFVIVVTGELMHTEKRPRGGGKRASVAHVAIKPHGTAVDDGDAMATRKEGEFFRFQGLGGHGSAKLNKMMTDLSQIKAMRRSTILILTPEGLGRAIESAKRVGGESPALNILEEMGKQDVAQILAKVPCFEPLDRRMRSTLAQLFSYEVVPTGKKVYKEGDMGDNFCILLQGELNIYQGETKVATRLPQAFLGEIALLYNCERTATVQCDTVVSSVLTLRAEHFQRLLDKVPDMREIIEGTQRCRIVFSFLRAAGVYTDAQTEETHKDELVTLSKLVRVESYQAGTVLHSKDKPNTSFYMVYQGSVKRTRHDAGGKSTETQTLKAGSYAGGISMLRSDGTVEEVVTDSSCLILVAEGEKFFSLLEHLAPLHAVLTLRAFQKQASLSAILEWPKAFDPWRAFSADEYAAENPDFWKDTTAFLALAKAEPPTPIAKLKEECEQLVATYIVDMGDKQVNVPSGCQRACIAAAEVADTAEAYATLFSDSRGEIYNLMKRDTLPRFLNTPYFEDFLASLGEPMPIPACDVPLSLATARSSFLSQTGDLSVSAVEADYKSNYGAPAPAGN